MGVLMLVSCAYWILTNERLSRLARVLARCTIIGRCLFRVEHQ
nr:MAG TPA: hypothetical protein [Caudoviricetes sp.]